MFTDGPCGSSSVPLLFKREYMFKVRANFSETFEIDAGFDKVRDFFADIRNFIEYMPSIESIHTDAKGITYWRIRADIPFVGSFVERFPVRETENSDERVEWSPLETENYNLLRYAADFLPKSGRSTLVQFSQNIELRRESASELHLLAGLVGETLIGNEMSRRIAQMLNSFIEKARNQLES
jgi:carbon monoxide dehydrogenase subunit G